MQDQQIEQGYGARTCLPCTPTFTTYSDVGWSGMCVHAGARLLDVHHKNPLGLHCTVAAHSIGQYLLHHCAAWIRNHASEHTNSAVQMGYEERTKLLLTEMYMYRYRYKGNALQCPCIVPHLAAVLYFCSSLWHE